MNMPVARDRSETNIRSQSEAKRFFHRDTLDLGHEFEGRGCTFPGEVRARALASFL